MCRLLCNIDDIRLSVRLFEHDTLHIPIKNAVNAYYLLLSFQLAVPDDTSNVPFNSYPEIIILIIASL